MLREELKFPLIVMVLAVSSTLQLISTEFVLSWQLVAIVVLPTGDYREKSDGKFTSISLISPNERLSITTL